MWSRVDDNIPHHPKFVKAGAVASWLWICGNCYANRYLTDGYIPTEIIPTLSQVYQPFTAVAKLVEVGLWETVKGGYQIHDFHDHNPFASEVKAKREQDRLRKKQGDKSHNSRRIPDGFQADSARIPEVPARAIPSQSHPSPIPSHINTNENSSPLRGEPVAMVFPTTGKITDWELTERQIGEWVSAYPSLNVESEVLKARAWVMANPTKRKSAKGMPKFLVGWFNRSTERPSNAPPVKDRRTDWEKAKDAGLIGKRHV